MPILIERATIIKSEKYSHNEKYIFKEKYNIKATE